jgi:anti-sigma factor RsiW
MLSCPDSERLIVRRADGVPLDSSSAAALDRHLESCASCREALAAQDSVAAILRSRPADEVSPGFSARLARRLDEPRDFLDSIDWRAWTFRLTPVAAALALVAYLTTAEADRASAIDEWAAPAGGTVSSLLQDDGVTSDSLLEQMLTGEAAAGGGSSVR